VARRLINEKGYSKDLVKVLLGGWGAWKDNNVKDPAGYPINTGGGVAPGTGNQPGGMVLTPDSGPSTEGTPARRVLLVTTPQP